MAAAAEVCRRPPDNSHTAAVVLQALAPVPALEHEGRYTWTAQGQPCAFQVTRAAGAERDRFLFVWAAVQRLSDRGVRRWDGLHGWRGRRQIYLSLPG